MKRFGLILISMLLLILQLSGDNTERADLRVVLDLKNENSIEIGFSENAVYTMQSSVDAIDTLRLDITPEQVAENYGVSVEDAKNMQKNFTSAIEEKKNYLKEQGWM